MGVEIRPIRPDDLETTFNTFNLYADDLTVELENWEEHKFMFAPDGLAGKGNILYLDGKPAAYAFLTSIDREREHYGRKTLPDFFVKCWERANMSLLIHGLEKLLGKGWNWWFLMDYGALPEHRQQGLTKQVLMHTLDELGPDDIKVGFIDLKRPQSIPASSKSGNVYPRVVPQAYDGQHPALLSIYGKRLKVSYQGEVITFDPMHTLAERVSSEIAKGLTVGYDKEKDGLRAGKLGHL